MREHNPFNNYEKVKKLFIDANKPRKLVIPSHPSMVP
jgi:hypothetical protein